LYRKEGKELNKDSVVVVIQHSENAGVGAHGPEYPLDNTAQFLSDTAGKKLINWGRAAGID
jgi:hypothetical protein